MMALQPGVLFIETESWRDLPQPGPNAPLPVLPHRQVGRLPQPEFNAYAARIREHIACRVVANRDGMVRLGRVLACLKRMDLAPVGWPSFSAFCRENVELSLSLVRQLIRLAEADLPEVLAALRRGEISRSAALDAVRETTREGESQWLDAHRRGLHRRRPPLPEAQAAHTDAADVEAVIASRSLACLISGRRFTDAQADRFVRDAFEMGDPSALLDQYRSPPPPPPPLSPLPDDPTSVDDALQQLAALQAELRLGELWLGQLYNLVRDQGAVWSMGFDSLGHFARWLGQGRRTLEEYAVLAQNVALHPDLGVALTRGLPMQKVRLIADIVEETTAAEWVALAENTTTTELTRAKSWAEAEGAATVLAAYADARDRVAGSEQVDARDRVAGSEQVDARDRVAGSEEVDARDRVAVRQSQDHEPVPGLVFVSALQVRAARWFVEHVRLPPRHGFGKAAEHDDFVCQNPRCGKRCWHNQAHHLVFRSHGGTDEPGNLITVCPGCHLRGIHSGWMTVRRVPDGWSWRYVDGDRVFVLDRSAA